MTKFIPKEKLGKKARIQIDNEQRTTWAFSPVTKKVESKKRYNRKRKAHDRYDDYGMGLSYGFIYGERVVPLCNLYTRDEPDLSTITQIVPSIKGPCSNRPEFNSSTF